MPESERPGQRLAARLARPSASPRHRALWKPCALPVAETGYNPKPPTLTLMLGEDSALALALSLALTPSRRGLGADRCAGQATRGSNPHSLSLSLSLTRTSPY